MVSPQNPQPGATTTGPGVTGRGFVMPEEVAALERQAPVMVKSHVSWGSVIAGSLLSLSLLLLSATFAYACGVPAFRGTGSFGWGAGIWSVITSIIAFACGGYLSAYLAAASDRRFNVLHGLMAWVLCVSLMFVVFASAQAATANQAGMISGELSRIAGRGMGGTGAAWGSFISLACGLIAAAIGGSAIEQRRYE